MGRQKSLETRRRNQRDHERRRRLMLDAIKLSSGCIDCGYKENATALDFDHRDPSTKVFNIGSYKRVGLERLLIEVEKCDIRCANCHRVKSLRLGESGRKMRD